MPRGGGKGGTLLRAHSFKLRHELEALFLPTNFEELEELAACNQITHTKICPPAETGRCTKRRGREAVP